LARTPGYPDRANFGRVELNLSPEAVADSVYQQVRALAEIAERNGVSLTHVKPHGALYNQAVHNRQLAKAIAKGVARWKTNIVLVGLAGSPMLMSFATPASLSLPKPSQTAATSQTEPCARENMKTPNPRSRGSPPVRPLSIVEQGFVLARNGSEVAVSAQTICITATHPAPRRLPSP